MKSTRDEAIINAVNVTLSLGIRSEDSASDLAMSTARRIWDAASHILASKIAFVNFIGLLLGNIIRQLKFRASFKFMGITSPDGKNDGQKTRRKTNIDTSRKVKSTTVACASIKVKSAVVREAKKTKAKKNKMKNDKVKNSKGPNFVQTPIKKNKNNRHLRKVHAAAIARESKIPKAKENTKT